MIQDPVLQADLKYGAHFLHEKANLTHETFLVTGATGLIGSLIIKTILYYNQRFQASVKVIGIARNPKKAKKIFTNDYHDPHLHLLYSDITSLTLDNEKIDYIIHTASPTGSSFFIQHPVETIETNVFGTNQVLKLAQTCSIKSMAYLSSMEAYGKTAATSRRTMENELGFLNLSDVRTSYPASKRLCENLCYAYSKEYDVPVKVARLAQTFGAGIPLNETRVFAQFARGVLAREDIILHTTGESMGNYCYTTDTITAIFTLLFNGINGEIYNVCNEENTSTIRDMAQMVCRDIADNSIQVVYDIPTDNKYGYAGDTGICLSAAKLYALGWHATIDLKESYRRMINSMYIQKMMVT